MTDTELVRMLISDDVLPYHFTDVQIQAFLTLAGGSVYLAAALALKSWAASLTAAMTSERIGDYSYSNSNVTGKIALADEYIKINATYPEMDIASLDLVTTPGSTVIIP